MKLNVRPASLVFLLATLVLVFPAALAAADWAVPFAGNSFPSQTDAGDQRSSRHARTLYFYVDRPAELDLLIRAKALKGAVSLTVECAEKRFEVTLNGSKAADQDVGQVSVGGAGYVAVKIAAPKNEAKEISFVDQLVVSSETKGLKLDFVKSNQGNMFYWGRRGPSVHLRYEVPRGMPLQYAYSEITVPRGSDPIGSYFMANGFGQGYFGIQVNGPTERRVLFSVWSPFKTDNPKDIPADQRVVALAKGADVRVNDFGNEGSGGQSYLVYPWAAGKTYRFLTEVRPDGEGNTIYTSWFGECPTESVDKSWMLVASFRRPKTDVNLTGFHSFLENFSPQWGHVQRQAFHGNVWVRDTLEQWHECTRARFSVDATGRGRHRLDFTGGADGDRFYLRNCGFFNETGKPGSTFERSSLPTAGPEIQFDQLPR